MATTHVLIVDSRTLKLHLEYMFAGTGSKKDAVDFNNSPKTTLHHTGENKLCGMIADFGRVRLGDKIIFYLQAQNGKEGKFYGVFKVKSTEVFLENYSNSQYLLLELGKNLTFRVEIEPDTVYAKGVTEWEALDSIQNLTSPNQMLWSLIYRKLKGNRGNTMITPYESDRLIQLIRTTNSRTTLSGNKFTFNPNTQLIETSTHMHYYSGNTPNTINILPRLIYKLRNGKAFEAHLQAYITQNIGRQTNQTLDNTVIPQNSRLEWIGNEVSCGVGMQRIDICLSVSDGTQKTVIPIELKAVEANSGNLRQLQRYVDWLEQYYLPNRPSDIQPMLITRKGTAFLNSNSSIWTDFLTFDQKNSTLCKPISVIEYDLVNNNLQFTKVK
ncbi:DUF91 domain-containing protein [Ornithobacterium rhinotracheale]|uniref:DUF91 domain-containing protein n=1 Tax=Ornithobacterium rhinotracheale TaxID=28251 RepID=UPI00129CE724|nr:DUF91 domain-containing protein [Ornithobacterium rhinotracheale]MRI64579.1 DUF91 domain-containing protein [Ornithobacterium rhinotracheale]